MRIYLIFAENLSIPYFSVRILKFRIYTLIPHFWPHFRKKGLKQNLHGPGLPEGKKHEGRGNVLQTA